MTDSHLNIESVRWLSHFIKEPTEIQYSIYYSWLVRIIKYYQELFHLPYSYFSNNSYSFVFKKSFYFLHPYWLTLRSPFELPYIHKAIDIFKDIFYTKEPYKLVLYGDRDADGLSAISILYCFLRDEMKISENNMVALVPEENDKYGITETVIPRIIEEKPTVLIVLDCGSSNKTELDSIRQQIPNIKIIIVDHHFIPENTEDYPNVEAFINPKQLDIFNPNRELCSAGIIYKLLWALMFSFTSEYNSITQINHKDKIYYFKNGILTKDHEELPIKRIIDYEPTNSGAQTWSFVLQEVCAKNKDLSQIYSYINHYKHYFSIEEEFQFFFHAQLENIFLRTQPYLSMASVATVGDVMSLMDDNRVLVTIGLQQLNTNLEKTLGGLFGIIQAFDLKKRKITEDDYGFFICPSINAAGRLGKAEVALDLLTEKDKLNALKKAYQLRSINEERKVISNDAVKMLESVITLHNYDQFPIIAIYHAGIHRGISGLIANKLAEQYKKLAIVIVDDNDCLRGSMRSYKNENAFALLQHLSSYCIQCGGHRQAAGFSIDRANLDSFIQEAIRFVTTNPDIIQSVEEDADLLSPIIYTTVKELRASFWTYCFTFAPYGQLNPVPLLSIDISQEERLQVYLMGEEQKHARILFVGSGSSSMIEAVWFFHNGEALKLTEPKQRTIVAKPQFNFFNGKTTYQLNIQSVT